ncbi:dihydropyrimidinase [Bacillota bacterium Meth-B3]
MTIIQGGRLVSPKGIEALDIAIEHGVIARVAAGIAPAPGDAVIDARGCLVFPGFIDAHTHFDMDAGATVTADDFASGTAAAIAGGTTCVIDFATQDRGMTLQEALAIWHRKAEGKSSCNYAFHMAITDWNDGARAALSEMVRAGVTSFKLYLAYDALRVNDATLLDILREAGAKGLLVGVHCENGDLVNALIARERAAGRLSPAAIPASRPAEVEAEAVARLCYVAALASCPVMVVHLSTEMGLAAVRAARARGQTVLAETCPHYLTMTDEVYRLPGFESAKYACSPPMRGEADRRALLAAAASGEIDTISTDHCSFNFKGQKALGREDFSKIPNGLPGVEHRPALIYNLVREGALTEAQMCDLLAARPAKLYGMYPRKGALLPLSDADIVVWEDAEGTIRAADQHQRVDYTPYEGVRVRGRARAVLLGGEVVCEHGQLIRANLGRYVARNLGELTRKEDAR